MDFQKEVIEKSKQEPVVVDFWAPWCGPCKFLGPVIEELAAEHRDKWALVKVNTDENPELSNQYKIRGIPAVKMFRNGEVVAEFTGALPKHQIEQWLESHLPDERKDQLLEFRKKLGAGQEITGELSKFVDQNPDFDEGKYLLAKVIVFADPAKSGELLKSLKTPHKYVNEIEDLKSLIDLMACDAGESGLAEKIDAARNAVKRKDYDIALDNLIQVVMVDKSFCEEMPRRATIALFHWLGDQHELTLKYRRRFDMALY